MGENKYYTQEEINYEDAGIVTIGPNALRIAISKALINVPSDIVDDVFENCRFLMMDADEKGIFVRNRIIKNRNIISFPQALLSWPEKEQTSVILHEITHYILGHKTSFEDISQWERQEKEADDLKNKWLKERSDANSITK